MRSEATIVMLSFFAALLVLLLRLHSSLRSSLAIRFFIANSLHQQHNRYLTFQINLQKGMCSYFLARSVWDKGVDGTYGIAIAMLHAAQKVMATRDGISSPGIPPIDSGSALRNIVGDLNDMRAHIAKLTAAWVKDNDSIYFNKIPERVPEDRKLAAGSKIINPTAFNMSEDVEPVKLGAPDQKTAGQGDLPAPTAPPPPTAPIQRSDSDLARELQEKLNAGEDI